MKYLIPVFCATFTLLFSCRTPKKIEKVIAPIDSSLIRLNASREDSIRLVDTTLKAFKVHHIDFKTFSAKIKVEAEASGEKQPDLTALVKIVKDSAIWISISSTFLNIEVYRLYISRDSVILLKKQDKIAQYRSLDYLQEVTGIPIDYKTLEDLLIGNPIFYSDSLISFQKQESVTLLSTHAGIFKNLLTLANDTRLLMHCKLDDLDITRHRTANISYSEFENSSGFYFPVYRHIVAAEKNNLDIRMTYKQYEFNKELSVSFSIPKNYKRN